MKQNPHSSPWPIAADPEVVRRVLLLGLLAIGGVFAGLIVLRFSPPKVLAAGIGLAVVALSIRKIEFPFYVTLFLLVVAQEGEATKGSLFAYLEMLNRPGVPSLVEVAVGVLTMAVALGSIFYRDKSAVSPFKAPFLIYAGLLLVGLVMGFTRSHDPIILKEDFKKLLIPLLFLFCSLNILISEERIHRTVVFVFVLTLLKACLGILYYFGGLGFAYGDWRVVFLESADVLLVATVAIVLFSKMTSERMRVGKLLLYFGAIVPMLLALFFSYRRNAWLGFLASLALLFLLLPDRRRMRMALFGGCLGLCALVLVFSSTMASRAPSDRLLSEKITSMSDRDYSSNVAHVNEWLVAMEDTLKSPVFGLGLGSVHSPTPGFEGIQRHTVHNAFIMLWMKMGIFAVILLFWCIVRYVVFELKSLKVNRGGPGYALQLGLFAMVGFWMVAVNVGPTWFYTRETCLMALTAATAIQLAKLRDSAARTKS